MVNIFISEIYKQICIIKNSKFKFISGLILNLIILMVVISLNSDNTYEELFYIVSWYAIIWIIFSGLTQTYVIVNEEVKSNTIYRLILSPYGVGKILITKLLVKSIISISFISCILYALQFLLNNINIYQIIQFSIVAFIGLISINSIGIILGFLSLISPNIQLITTIIRISIIFSMISFKANIIIPFSYAKEIIIDLILLNKSISTCSMEFIIGFLINTLIYVVISFIISKYIEKNFLEKGTFIL